MAPSAVTPDKLSPACLSFNILSCERQEASAILGNAKIVLHCYTLQAPEARFPDHKSKQLPINANESHVHKSLLSAH